MRRILSPAKNKKWLKARSFDEPSKFREVLECGSPLPLWKSLSLLESGRGLPQSKTLARRTNPASAPQPLHDFDLGEFMNIKTPSTFSGLLLAACLLCGCADRRQTSQTALKSGP